MIFFCAQLFVWILLVAKVSSEYSIDSVFPKAVGAGGGVPLTVFGRNLLTGGNVTIEEQDMKISLFVGETNCPINLHRSSLDVLVCDSIPPYNLSYISSIPQLGEIAEEVEVPLRLMQGNATILAATTFFYQRALTPTWSNVDHVAIAGDSISIDGDFLGADDIRVSFQENGGTCDRNVANASSLPLNRNLVLSELLPLNSSRLFCSIRYAIAGFYTPFIVTSTGAAVKKRDQSTQIFKIQNDGSTSFAVHVFANVSSVSPATTGAGAIVTVSGRGFPTEKSQLKAFFGHAPCEILHTSETKFICVQSSITSLYTYLDQAPTQVGLVLQTWENVNDTLATITDLASRTPTRTFTGPMDLEATGGRIPSTHSATGWFVAQNPGMYRFLCSATDFVQVSIDDAIVCQSAGAPVNTPGLRFFSGSPRSGPGTEILLQNQSYKIKVVYGLHGPHSSYRVSLGFSPSNSDQPFPRPEFTLPAIFNITASPLRSFVIQLGLTQSRVPAVFAGEPCSVIAAAPIIEKDFPGFRVREAVLRAPDGKSCSVILEILVPGDTPSFEFRGAASEVLLNGSSSELLFDPLPARFLFVPFQQAASGGKLPLRVFVKDEAAAYHTVGISRASSMETVFASSQPEFMTLSAGEMIAFFSQTPLDSSHPIKVRFIKNRVSELRWCEVPTVLPGGLQLNCTVPAMPAGVYKVEIFLGEKGLLKTVTGNPIYALNLMAITSKFPAINTWFGGSTITLRGVNFPTDDSAELSMTVGTLPGRIIVTTADAVLFLLPPHPLPRPVNGSMTGSITLLLQLKMLNASQEQMSLVPSWAQNYVINTSLLYSWLLTPTITSIQPSSGSGSSSYRVTIFGQLLTSQSLLVQFCSQNLTVCVPCLTDGIATTSTRLECDTNPVADGFHVVLAETKAGRSNVNISYTASFRINQIIPKIGSIYGGTVLTIVGNGLSNNVDVDLGPATCPVSFANETHVLCTVGRGEYLSQSIQVKVYAGTNLGVRVQATCSNLTACQYIFNSSSATPYLVGVGPDMGQAVLLTLTGLNFRGTETITVSNQNCEVTEIVPPTSENPTMTMYCELPSVAGGVRRVDVVSHPYGVVGPLNTFTSMVTVKSIFPRSGSAAGGQLVTLIGSGFSSVEGETNITLAGIDCLYGPLVEGTEVNATVAVCETTKLPMLQDLSGLVSVTVGGYRARCCEFRFETTKTPVITRISPLTGSEGDVINISGTLWNLPAPNVSLARIPIGPVIDQHNFGFAVILPKLPALRAQLRIQFPYGRAWVSVQDFAVFPYVDPGGIIPQYKSRGGGLPLNISGGNFVLFPEDEVQVTVCGVDCPVLESNHTFISCMPPAMRNALTFTSQPETERTSVEKLDITFFVTLDLPNAKYSVDGDEATIFVNKRPSSGNLEVGIDLGDQRYASLESVRVLPANGTESYFDGALIQLSMDASTWTSISRVGHFRPGWNTVTLPSQLQLSRYLKFVAAPNVAQLEVAEFEVRGAVGGRVAADTCPVIIFVQRPGTVTLSTCTERPAKCVSAPDSISYSISGTPSVQRFSPSSATMDQEVTLMLSGSMLDITFAHPVVKIDGVTCNITNKNAAQMMCNILKPSTSIGQFGAVIDYPEVGQASIEAPTFHFTEPWSAVSSWRGLEFPIHGSVVVIPTGRTIALDVSTPRLEGLIVRGTLIIDSTLPVTITTGYIVIEGGGKIAAGNSNTAYLNELTIRLTKSLDGSGGHPIYGSRVIALVDGILELAGISLSPTFDRLRVATVPGDRNITLGASVAAWPIGTEIGIAPSDRSEPFEGEIKRCINVTKLNLREQSVVLDEPLRFAHRMGSEAVGPRSLDYGAEVIVLSRNIRIEGDSEIEREGPQIIVAPSRPAATLLRLQGVEFEGCGRLGDPNGHCLSIGASGDYINSQVKSCSFYNTFARAINIEGSNRADIRDNVFFNIRGHAVALSGGNSRFAKIMNNVAVAGLPSFGIDGEEPAGFYITHPTVDLSNNIASSFYTGFLFDFPVSSAFDTRCPKSAPAGRNSRNVALRNRLHGMHVVQHHPRSMECSTSALGGLNAQASIRNFEAYDNYAYGLFLEDVGEYLVSSSSFLQNGVAGINVKKILHNAKVRIQLTTFVASSSLSNDAAFWRSIPSRTIPPAGVNAPGSEGLEVFNCSFERFNNGFIDPISNVQIVPPTYAIVTCTDCDEPETRQPGGFTYFFQELWFPDSPNRLYLAPPHDVILADYDGSLFFEYQSDAAGGTNYTGILRYPYLGIPEGCFDPVNITAYSGPSKLIVCDEGIRFHRVLLFDPQPTVIRGSNMTLTSVLGSGSARFIENKQSPWGGGYVFILPTGLSGTILPNDDTNLLNFTFRSEGADWTQISQAGIITRLNIAFFPVIPMALPYLSVRFSFQSDLVRMDVLQRSIVDDGEMLVPIDDKDIVIPTKYTNPFVETRRDSNGNEIVVAGVSRSFLHIPTRLMHLIFEDTAPAHFVIEPIPCAATGCIRMQEPVRPAKRYLWTDARAWPNETLPKDGDDVVIPPGITLVLTTNTSRLRSLIVQGTLELHSRLPSEVLAAFVVIFGGKIVAPTAPHLPGAIFTLLSDMDTPPLGVDKDTVLLPGTFISFGTISIAGVERPTTWTQITQTLDPGMQEVKVADLVPDWVAGDVVVLSSGSFSSSEFEEVVVTQSTPDNRGFVTAAPLHYQHIGVTEETSGSLQLLLRSKAAILSRNIIIEGGSPTNRAGCQVIFSSYGRDPSFSSQGVLAAAEIRYCGFVNETETAAVQFINVNRYKVDLRGSAVHHSFGKALKMTNTTGVAISSNVFYHTEGSSVDAGNSFGNNFLKNIVIGTQFPSTMTDPDEPYSLCSYQSVQRINSFVGNVAAGSESEGFCIQLGICDDLASLVESNEAHSNVVGFFTVVTTGGETCVSASKLMAWHNSYIGISLALNTDVKLINPKVYDNHIGVYTSTVGTGNFIDITGGVIAGRSAVLDSFPCSYFTCSMRSRDRYCAGRYQLFGDRDGAESRIQGEVGLLIGSANELGLYANYSRKVEDLPFVKPRQYEWPAADGAVTVTNIIFANFLLGGEEGRCDGGRAVTTNEFLLNPALQHSFGNITWLAINEGGLFSVTPPSEQWRNPFMCDELCDSLNHVAILDSDGTLMQTNMPGSVVSNYAHAALLCTFNRRWGSYSCPGNYAQLHVTNLDSDAERRVIGPLKVQDEGFLARIHYVQQPPACYRNCTKPSLRRPGFITTVVETQRTYLIDFTGEPPRSFSLKLRNCVSNMEAIIVRILIDTPNDISVWSEGAKVPVASGSLTYNSASGSNYFEALDSRLYAALTCNVEVHVHQLVTTEVTVLLDSRIEAFNKLYRPIFRTAMAEILQVTASRVVLSEVYPASVKAGSTSVRFRLLAVDSVNYNATEQAASVNNKVMNLVTSPLDMIASRTRIPIVAIQQIRWATAFSEISANVKVDYQMTENFLIASIVIAVVFFFFLLFLAWRVYKMVLQHREYEQEITQDHGMQVPAAGLGDDFEMLQENQIQSPAVELGLKSLKITVDNEDEQEGLFAEYGDEDMTAVAAAPSAAASKYAVLNERKENEWGGNNDEDTEDY